MSAATVITRGYGSGGSTALVVTRGYSVTVDASITPWPYPRTFRMPPRRVPPIERVARTTARLTAAGRLLALTRVEMPVSAKLAAGVSLQATVYGAAPAAASLTASMALSAVAVGATTAVAVRDIDEEEEILLLLGMDWRD